MLGIKQESLAEQLGVGWSQKKISILEGKEIIEDDVIDQFATLLQIPSDSIRYFNDSIAHEYIRSVQENVVPLTVSYEISTRLLSIIEKWFSAIDENKRLYEALLQCERDKAALLERILYRNRRKSARQ